MGTIFRAGLACLTAILCIPAFAQGTLGALLDAGATRLSPDQFKDELVQRVIVGPSSTGAGMELMYTSNGTIEGVFSGPNNAGVVNPNRSFTSTLNGDWRIDDSARICTSIRVSITTGSSLVLPPRCQVWFRLRDQYFLADSDTDRSAKVLVRTIKQ